MKELLRDFELKMNIKVSEEDIRYYSEGATDAIVFSIKDEYLIKKTNKNELDVYNEFFSKYKSDRYQKLFYINYDLSYVCLSFIKGKRFDGSIDSNKMIDILYETISNYKKIDYDGYGYLFEDHKTWKDFLKDEVEYSLTVFEDKNTKYNDNINKCLDYISKFNIDKYLLHGDFGTHNFIINENDVYYIDPMGLVGDPLYDFYFAIFSNTSIFKNIKIDDILKYSDRDFKYKKSLAYLAFIIRLCRTYHYNREDYNDYINYLENEINKVA